MKYIDIHKKTNIKPKFIVKAALDYKKEPSVFSLKNGFYFFTILTLVLTGLNFPPGVSKAVALPTNPPLTQSCGLDVALVLDVSGSMAPALAQMKTDLHAFVNALAVTPTEFSVTKFSDTASVVSPFTNNVIITNTAIDNALSVASGATNWQDGLLKAQSTFDPRNDHPNLVIFASDGDPNYYNNPTPPPAQLGPGNGLDSTSLSKAVVVANDLKITNTARILAIGITGNETVNGGLSLSSLEFISGPNVNTGSVLTSDVITGDVTALAGELATAATQLCGGTVTVTKRIGTPENSVAAGTGWTFNIGGQSKTTDSNGQTPAVTLTNGTYNITETGTVSGYSFGSASCTGATNNGSPMTNGVTGVQIGTDKIVSCIFYNTPNAGTLTVIKHVDNRAGGRASAGDFTINVSGGTPSSFSGSETGTSVSVAAGGAYSVTEATGGPANYSPSYDGSCSGTMAPGGTATCTITNTYVVPPPTQGTLTVTKIVTNDNGGSAQASNFSLHLTDGQNHVSDISSGQTLSLDPGTYTVSESNDPAGYKGSFSGDCPAGVVNIVVGQTYNCVLTNDDIAPKLTLIKHVSNTHGGQASASDWTVTAIGDQIIPVVLSGSGNVSSDETFQAGTYTLSETGSVANYTAGDWQCSDDVQNNGSQITLGIGQTATCKITNSDKAATLTVIKNVVNNNGGDKKAGNFTINVSGPGATPASFSGDGSGTQVSLNAGSYSVSENSDSGYSQNLSDDCHGTIAMGEQKTCIITNDDKAGTLTVVKHVSNTHGGTKVAGDFTVNVTGGNPSPASFSGDESGTQVSLDAGQYSVSESGPAGYTERDSEDCRGTIANGQSKTCTITNSDTQPKLTVIKVVENGNNPEPKAVSDFPLFVGQTSVVSGAQNSFDAGIYTVSETNATNYTASFSGDCGETGSVTLSVGDELTCTITNTYHAPPPPPPAHLKVIKLVSNTNGGTKTPGDFSIHVSGTNVSNPDFHGSADGTNLTLDAGNYTVSEDNVTGYTSESSQGCSGSVQSGDNVVCTITNSDQPGTLIVKKVLNNNINEASFSDFGFSVNAGNAVAFDQSGQNSQQVSAGTYNIVESPEPQGYTVTYDNCSEVSVANGETETCTITNAFVPPAQADLSVTKTVGDGQKSVSANVGDSVTFTVSVTNNGPDDATGVIVSDVVPANLTVTASSTATGTFNGSTWNVGSLANGASASLTITASVNSGTEGSTITNTATVTSDHDTNSGNNSSSANVNVNSGGGGGTTPSADLSLTKTTSETTIQPLDTVIYTLVATNLGPDSATSVVVTDNLPSNVTWISDVATQGSYDHMTGLWAVGTLANGASATLTITTTVNSGVGAGTVIKNDGSVSSAVHDPVLINNAASASSTVPSNSGGGGGGGGGSGPGPTGIPYNAGSTVTPAPTVLGEQTGTAPNPEPKVLGAATELPRTGMPIDLGVVGLALTGLLLPWLKRRESK